MSWYDYKLSLKIDDYSFYSLVMAAMRQADIANLKRLKAAFPDVWAELQERYNAPGGFLPGEPPRVI